MKKKKGTYLTERMKKHIYSNEFKVTAVKMSKASRIDFYACRLSPGDKIRSKNEINYGCHYSKNNVRKRKN